jgi:hypothetical protein
MTENDNFFAVGKLSIQTSYVTAERELFASKFQNVKLRIFQNDFLQFS